MSRDQTASGQLLTGAVTEAVQEMARQEAEAEQREIVYRHEAAATTEIRSRLLEHTRAAAPEDYASWLTGYVAAGGRITNVYSYNLPDSFYVVTSPTKSVPALYGANAVHLIVPATVDVGVVSAEFHGWPGHSTLHLMDGFRAIGCFVPVYRDVLAILAAPGLYPDTQP